MASASPNTSRPQPFACDCGVRKKPSVARGPKLIMEMRQPHSTITTGVRQVTSLVAAGIVIIELSGEERHCCGRKAQAGRHHRGPALAPQMHLREGLHPLGAWRRGLAKPRTRCYMGFCSK